MSRKAMRVHPKRIVVISFYSVIAILGIVLFFQVTNTLVPITNFPFGITNVMSQTRWFSPANGTVMSFDTPPAAQLASLNLPISCSLASNIHVTGNDLSDWSITGGIPMFSPASLILPYNGIQPSQITDYVYLYCNPLSPALQAQGYHPYLTGGSLLAQFTTKDVNGVTRVSFSSPSCPLGSPIVNTDDPKYPTHSVLICTFNEPASAISAVAGTSPSTFGSLQTISIWGTLSFLPNLQAQGNPNAIVSHVLNPALISTFTMNVQGTGATPQQSVSQAITITSPQGNILDASKLNALTFTVSVDNWNPTEGTPVVTLTTPYAVNQPILIATLPPFTNPTPTTSGIKSIWQFAYPTANLAQGNGNYVLQVNQKTVSGGTRPAVSASFDVINWNNSPPPSPPCAQPNVLQPNGQCLPPTPTPITCTAPQVLSADGTKCVTPTPTPVSCTLPQIASSDGTTCITPSTNPSTQCTQAQLSGNPPMINSPYGCIPNPANALVQLQQFLTTMIGSLITIVSGNIVTIFIGIVIIAILYHFIDKKRGGKGLAPEMLVPVPTA